MLQSPFIVQVGVKILTKLAILFSFSSFLFCVCLLSVSSLTNTSLLRTVCFKCVHLVYLMVYFLFVCFFFDNCLALMDSLSLFF